MENRQQQKNTSWKTMRRARGRPREKQIIVKLYVYILYRSLFNSLLTNIIIFLFVVSLQCERSGLGFDTTCQTHTHTTSPDGAEKLQ